MYVKRNIDKDLEKWKEEKYNRDVCYKALTGGNL